MADIFLSYAGEDRETAGKLAQCFEASGLTVWWDRKIPAGMTWRQVIEKSLHDMACMVVLWSTSSINSAWVNEEAEEGRTRDKLVPVLIEPVVPPLGFRGIQAADLTAWDGSADAPGLRQLMADLEARLGRLSGTAATGKTPAAPPVAQPPRRKLPPAVAAASLVLLLAVATWWWYAGQPQDTAEPARTRPETASAAKATAAATAGAPAAPISPPPGLAPAAVEAAASGSPSLKAATTGAAAGGTATVSRSTRPDRESFPRDARPARCRDLLERQGLGDPLSAEDRSFVHKECRS